MNPSSLQVAPGHYAKLNLLLDIMGLGFCFAVSSAHKPEYLFFFAALIAGAWCIASAAAHFYDPWSGRSLADDLTLMTVLLLGLGVALDISALILPAGVAMPRGGRFILFAWPLLAAMRAFVFRPLFRREEPIDSVLIVGAGTLGRITGGDLMTQAQRQVLGYLALPGQMANNLPMRVLGEAADLEATLRKEVVDEVYFAANLLRDPQHADAVQAAIKICERFGVPFALAAQHFRFDRAHPAAEDAIKDGYLHYLACKPKPYQRALKRLFDIVASSAALWALSPLLITVAALVKLTSKGPVLFKQERVGLHGKRFHMFKFRSMVVNAEALQTALLAKNEQSGPVFKMKDDPRITWIGRFIRKYSIDELPQLVNVLRGDMSVVGPRPPVPQEVAKYESWQRRRLSVRPGLTCIWQVSGRNNISFEEWMYLDMRYVDNWNLMQDFSLILQTVPVVLVGRGAS